MCISWIVWWILYVRYEYSLIIERKSVVIYILVINVLKIGVICEFLVIKWW